jgi:ribosomal protein S18 acetylase RimI-like enzyme
MSAQFRLKRVNADDTRVWARIVAMDAKCFAENAPALSDNSGAWWIAYTGDEEAGYCGIKQSSTGKGYGYLCRAGVLPKYRGCGLQKQMIRCRVAYARAQGWQFVVTDTHENNASSNSLIACGFRLYDPDVRWSFETSLYWKKLLLPK